MKAAQFNQFGGPEVLEIVDRPDPHAGPGQIRIAVRAAGINATDWKVRRGQMGGDLPQTTGHDVAGVVDEVGAGVTDAAVGDRVFGLADNGHGIGNGAAEFAVLTDYAPIPPALGFAEAAGLPVAVETATRSLDALGVGAGQTLLVSGAAGGIGSTAVQLAVARGATVIGTASPSNHDYLRSLGAEPVAYGPGLVERVRAHVDKALDVAGSGVLPDLIELAGGPANVVTIADFEGARTYGVKFSSGGDDGHAFRALHGIGALIEAGRFSLPVERTFPLADIAEAHRVSEAGHVRGRLVLLIG